MIYLSVCQPVCRNWVDGTINVGKPLPDNSIAGRDIRREWMLWNYEAQVLRDKNGQPEP